MVITIPAQERPFSGPRPINLNKDVPQVIKLLELAFGHRLGSDGQRIFNSGAGLNQPSFLWRFNPMSGKLALGYVWEEDGRIVGNATLIPTREKERYLVVNVAVHPDFQRRGIAHNLMESLQQLVQERRGRQIVLQVVKDNLPAIHLYQSLHFDTLGDVTTWRCSPSRLRDIEPAAGGENEPAIRELSRHHWQAAYQLDTAAFPPALNWPEALPQDVYKIGFWRRLDNFLNGRHTEVWVTTDTANQLTGLAGIWSEWGHVHQVTLRVHPSWRGQLERPLLAKIIRRLHTLPRRNIRLDHQEDDTFVSQLLREANFQPQRTLTHMRLDLGKRP